VGARPGIAAGSAAGNPAAVYQRSVFQLFFVGVFLCLVDMGIDCNISLGELDDGCVYWGSIPSAGRHILVAILFQGGL